MAVGTLCTSAVPGAATCGRATRSHGDEIHSELGRWIDCHGGGSTIRQRFFKDFTEDFREIP
jgi:hypothetical protein